MIKGDKRKKKISNLVFWQKPILLQKKKQKTRLHTNATKNFDYTTIVDQLKTVSFGNDSNHTGVVKPVNGIPTNPPTHFNSCVIKGTDIQVLFYS